MPNLSGRRWGKPSGAGLTSFVGSLWCDRSQIRRNLASLLQTTLDGMTGMPEEGNRICRSPWDGFPDATVQTTIAKLRSNRAYAAAKRGDEEAAFELVRALIKPQKIAFQFDAVVPVAQFNWGWPNALPLVYATEIARYFDADLSAIISERSSTFFICLPYMTERSHKRALRPLDRRPRKPPLFLLRHRTAHLGMIAVRGREVYRTISCHQSSCGLFFNAGRNSKVRIVPIAPPMRPLASGRVVTSNVQR